MQTGRGPEARYRLDSQVGAAISARSVGFAGSRDLGAVARWTAAMCTSRFAVGCHHDAVCEAVREAVCEAVQRRQRSGSEFVGQSMDSASNSRRSRRALGPAPTAALSCEDFQWMTRDKAAPDRAWDLQQEFVDQGSTVTSPRRGRGQHRPSPCWMGAQDVLAAVGRLFPASKGVLMFGRDATAWLQRNRSGASVGSRGRRTGMRTDARPSKPCDDLSGALCCSTDGAALHECRRAPS